MFVSSSRKEDDDDDDNDDDWLVFYVPFNMINKQHVISYSILTCPILKTLTHCSLETPKKAIGKQCRPRSDAADSGVDQGLHCLQIV